MSLKHLGNYAVKFTRFPTDISTILPVILSKLTPKGFLQLLVDGNYTCHTSSVMELSITVSFD